MTGAKASIRELNKRADVHHLLDELINETGAEGPEWLAWQWFVANAGRVGRKIRMIQDHRTRDHRFLDLLGDAKETL